MSPRPQFPPLFPRRETEGSVLSAVFPAKVPGLGGCPPTQCLLQCGLHMLLFQLQGYLPNGTARHSPGLLVPSVQAASAKGPTFGLSWENGAPSFPVLLEIKVAEWGAREMWARCSCVGDIKHLQIRKREACGVELVQSSDSLGCWH